MHFETALNLIWLLFGAVALASTIRVRRRSTSRIRLAPAWLDVCGVALIIAALFPYISATDDILRIEHMTIHRTHDREHSSEKKSSSDELMRLYEIMDAPVIVEAHQVTVSIFFVPLPTDPARTLTNRAAPSLIGRSPPQLAVDPT